MGTMIERMQELEHRVGAVENDARNAVARIEELESRLTRAADGASVESRIDAIEARLPAPIPVVTPLAHAGAALPDYLLAPTPDYSSDLPAEVDACGCEESEALRAELGQAPTRIDIDASTIAQLTARAEQAERRLAAANALLRECVQHGLKIGAAQLLKRIRAHLASAQPAAKSRRCDDCGAIHGTGNTNSLCPKASNYSPEFARREGTID